MTQPIHELIRSVRALNESRRALAVRSSRNNVLGGAQFEQNLIVSLTSFPARIKHAWMAIESVFQQTALPERIVLVLSIEEFPGKKLPRSIQKQIDRGLEVFWTDRNLRSYDKLLPVLEKFGDWDILTIDDDKFLPHDAVRELRNASLTYPGEVIGGRGWQILPCEGELRFGEAWVRADLSSNPARVFLTGNGGILYPKNSLHECVKDISTALRLAPTSDDIWFWAASVLRGTGRRCLGKSPYVPIHAQRKTPALNKENLTRDVENFRAVVNHFALEERLGRTEWGGTPQQENRNSSFGREP